MPVIDESKADGLPCDMAERSPDRKPTRRSHVWNDVLERLACLHTAYYRVPGDVAGWRMGVEEALAGLMRSYDAWLD